jgi:cytidine deaminase
MLLPADQVAALFAAARGALPHAYAPYSRFAVAAALLAADGRIFAGVNVENSSYGLTICAERSAVACAVSAGVRDFVAIAVVCQDAASCAPCGACRQVLCEFAPNLLVLLEDRNGPVQIPLTDLLPRGFTLRPPET